MLDLPEKNWPLTNTLAYFWPGIIKAENFKSGTCPEGVDIS
jgi:hypothetical protein